MVHWVKYVQAKVFIFFQAFKSEDLPRFTQNLFSEEENSECPSPDPDLVPFDRVPDDLRWALLSKIAFYVISFVFIPEGGNFFGFLLFL
jgi:hypothetical protein